MRSFLQSGSFFPQHCAYGLLHLIDTLVQMVSSVFFEHLPFSLYGIQIRRVRGKVHDLDLITHPCKEFFQGFGLVIRRILKEQDELAVFLVDTYPKLDIVCSVDPVIEFTVQCPIAQDTYGVESPSGENRGHSRWYIPEVPPLLYAPAYDVR